MTVPSIVKREIKGSKKSAKIVVPTTHVLCIVDQSGSMCGKENAIVSGLNEIVSSTKRDIEKGGSVVTLSVIRLDGVVLPFDLLQADPASISPFSNNWYKPGGSTPLYDAIGTGVVKLEESDDSKKDVSFVVYIMTDGLENASQTYTADIISRNIKRLEETGRWTFIWSITKADFDSAAKSLNFNTRNMQGYENSSVGTITTTSSTATGIQNFLTDRRSGVTSTADFYNTYTTSDPAPVVDSSSGVTNPNSVPSIPAIWTKESKGEKKPKITWS